MKSLLSALALTTLIVASCASGRRSPSDADADGDLQCGDERAPLEIDPEMIVNGDASWDASVVALSEGQALSVGALMTQGRGGAWSNGCTATLIAPGVVLTAAHCVTNYMNGRVLGPRQVRFAIGEDVSRPLQTFEVTAVHRHGGYRPSGGGNATHDVALLELTENATAVVPEIEPIAANCEAVGAEFMGQSVQNVGYGITEPYAGWPPPPDNHRRYWAVEEVVEITDFDFVVDGHGVAAVCNGDSGGPSLWTMPDGVIRVMGTVSWGDPSCVDRDHFARVDHSCDLVSEVLGGCGDVTEVGTCNGDVATYCAGGAVVETDCAASDRMCGPDEAGHMRCIARPDECAGETYEGRCDGDDVIWCQEGRILIRRCAECEQSCGWSEGHEAFYCID